jgi:endonuclease/exonuclease/phosphatase family metal-dependent hydrolase
LRVLTVNIHKGFSTFNRRFMLPALRDAIREVGADVVFLQEVLGRHDRHSMRVAHWPSTPHCEYLADTVWPEFAYGRNAVYDEGDHGNAVMSKFPIVSWRNHDVSQASRERRGLLHCQIRLPGLPRPLHAVCVHLALREQERQRQIGMLGSLLASEVPADAPLVVAGDFNDWRGLAHRKLHRFGLTEVNAGTGGRVARTFPSGMPVLPLDRIYVRGTTRFEPLTLPRQPWNRLSDHAPLAAHIQP